MKKSYELKIHNTTYTVEVKTAENSTSTPVELLKKIIAAEVLEQC